MSFIELIYLKIYELAMINFFRKIYGEQNYQMLNGLNNECIFILNLLIFKFKKY